MPALYQLQGALLLRFSQLTEPRVIWEEGTSIKKILPSDWSVGMSLRHFLFFIYTNIYITYIHIRICVYMHICIYLHLYIHIYY